jgi:hypothetical protein
LVPETALSLLIPVETTEKEMAGTRRSTNQFTACQIKVTVEMNKKFLIAVFV